MSDLIHLTIDGKAVTAAPGTLIINAAKQVGIEVPSFCYYDGLSLQAAWTTLVAAELVGALVGLGLVLNVAQQDIYPGMILVGMLSVGILGFAMTALLGTAERKALAWNVAAGSER